TMTSNSNPAPSKKRPLLLVSWLFLAAAVISTLLWVSTNVNPNAGIILAIGTATVAAVLGGISVATKRTANGVLCIVLSVLVIGLHVALILALRNMCVIC